MTLSTLALLFSSAALAEEIECDGQMIEDAVYDNLELSGGICIIAASTINGNVTINEGAGLIAEGTTIDGNIYGDHAEGLNLRALMGTATVVTGNVEMDGGSRPGVFIVRGSTIEGNLSISDWPGFVSVIGGDFNNNVEVSDVAQRIQLVDAEIAGNLELDGNGVVRITDSTIEGNATITDTVGQLWFDPGFRFPDQDNLVEGNLECSGNGSVNLASLQVNGSADGQCE